MPLSRFGILVASAFLAFTSIAKGGTTVSISSPNPANIPTTCYPYGPVISGSITSGFLESWYPDGIYIQVWDANGTLKSAGGASFTLGFMQYTMNFTTVSPVSLFTAATGPSCAVLASATYGNAVTSCNALSAFNYSTCGYGGGGGGHGP